MPKTKLRQLRNGDQGVRLLDMKWLHRVYIYMRIYIHNLRVCNVCMYIYIYTHAYIHSLFLLQSMGHTVTHLGHVYRHHLARIALPFAVAVGARLVVTNQMSWWWAWRVMGFLSDASSLFRALIMVVLFRLMFPLPWKR